MPTLENSKRQINTARYVPIQHDDSKDSGQDAPKAARAWDKLSYVRALDIREIEWPKIRGKINEVEDLEQRSRLRDAADLVEKLTVNISPANMALYARSLASTDKETLIMLGKIVAETRRLLKRELTASLEELRVVATEALGGTQVPPIAGHDVRLNSDVTTRLNNVSAISYIEPLGRGGQGSPLVSLKDALVWAGKHDETRVAPMMKVVDAFGPGTPGSGDTPQVAPISQIGPLIDVATKAAQFAVEGFEERMKVDPVGRLHLERLEMTPAGVERGELVYSVPLTPQETVNISHKEWSIRSEEFEKLVQDSFEEYSEEGVEEKKELSVSTEAQSQHTSAYSLSASYSGYGVSASVGYDSSSEDSEAQKNSLESSISITNKASARSRKDHRFSFKVSSVVGTENQEVRIITNPSSTATMRVDYYQLMRKWRVDYLRYGLRMTYDLVIPNPGADLISRIARLQVLSDAIDAPFSYSLTPEEITHENWLSKAMEYNASIDPPPLKDGIVERRVNHRRTDDDLHGFFQVEFDVGDGFEVVKAYVNMRFWDAWTAGGKEPVVFLDTPQDDTYSTPSVFKEKVHYLSASDEDTEQLAMLVGRSGKVEVGYGGDYLGTGEIHVKLITKLKPTALKEWQYYAWNTIRQAAEERYFQDRHILIERRDKLAAEIGQWDALTLRILEREAIMKGVLRWLFGPTFDFVPREVMDTLDSDSEKPRFDKDWNQVLEFGEFIKFIHHAIEWENMLYFTYPYFWSPRQQRLKRFLHHPDSRHQEFLRAGSARVVLTIRPGFEKSFTELMETGAFGTLWGAEEHDHPYVTIAEEIQNYANTNYPGISPANPEPSARPLLLPKQRQTWGQMQVLMALLEAYHADEANPTPYPPATANWIDGIIPYAGQLNLEPHQVPSVDAWGHPWKYEYPGLYDDYDLTSYGADGAVGGDNENADITSWAEASLIGRWYEYTPTSALDLSLNTDLNELA